MEYLKRYLEDKINTLTQQFEAIVVTGPRQAGKTTMLEHITEELFRGEIKKVSFDTPSEIDAFRRDPDLFFLNNPGKLFLDEVQHVPDIFPYILREINKERGKFRFFISGSQHFSLMKGVSESLSGRAGILDLWPLSRQEVHQKDIGLTLQIFENPSSINNILGKEFPINDTDHIAPFMLSGGYPPCVLRGLSTDWFESYRRTYLQRDIRELSQVADLGKFDRFLVLCAGRSGIIINKAEISRTLSVDSKTVDHWLSLLETSYQLVSIPSYHGNITKRLVKRPKIVFADSGLALHLQGIRSDKSLFAVPHFGSLFESYVIMEIRKLFSHAALPWNAYYFRTEKGIECDLVFDQAGMLLPIEIKHSARLSNIDLTPIKRFFDYYKKQVAFGFLISLHPGVEKITEHIYNIPLGFLL